MGDHLNRIFILIILSVSGLCRSEEYVVHVENSDRDNAMKVLESVATKISHLGKDQFYHVELPESRTETHLHSLKGVTSVKNTERKVSMRTPRLILPDPLSRSMWYWRSSRPMKVHAAHMAGYTGKGVTVCIIDDGVDHAIGELEGRYRPELSYDYVTGDTDPRPRFSQKHGTRVASVAVGGKLNGHCGYGAAPDAQFCAVRAISTTGSLSVRRQIQSYIGENEETGVSRDQETDIFISSWGGQDDGTSLDIPDKQTLLAMRIASVEGRRGKGSLIIFAAGNGGENDDCAGDGYVSNLYVTAVQSVSKNNSIPSYSEHCAASLTSAYVGDGLVAANPQIPNFPTDPCTSSFTGTSAAAPVVAGAAALAIEANPALTRRDLLHLMVHSSYSDPLTQDANWTTNSAGHSFSPYFGFGILNVFDLVERARSWSEHHFGEPYSCTYNVSELQSDRASRKFNIQCSEVSRIEYIAVQQSFVMGRERGKLQIFVISPSGTRIQMLKRRPNDVGEQYTDWKFVTPGFWNESPAGEWMIEVDAGDLSIFSMGATLEIYGVPHQYPTSHTTSAQPEATPAEKKKSWWERFKSWWFS